MKKLFCLLVTFLFALICSAQTNIRGNNGTFTGKINAASGPNVFSGIVQINGSTGLGSSGTGGTIAGGFLSPSVRRDYIGDGSGWQLEWAKRSASVDTIVATLTDSGNFRAAAGSLSSPSLSFLGDTGNGFYKRVNGFTSWTTGGVETFLLGAADIDIGNSAGLRFGSGNLTSVVPDTGIYRVGAATVAIGNATNGNASGTLTAAAIKTGAGSSLAIPSTGSNVVSDSATQTLTNKDLMVASSGNNVTLVNWAGPATAITGTAADANVYSFSIPANTIQAGKGIRISVGWQHTTGTASVSYKLKFGATTVATDAESGTGASAEVFYVMNNPGSTTAQTAWQESRSNNAIVYSTQFASPAENTTGAVTVAFTFNVAATDQVTPKFFLIELVQ